MSEKKYYLREWREVTIQEYIRAEKEAGFVSKFLGKPATCGFTGFGSPSNRVEGKAVADDLVNELEKG